MPRRWSAMSRRARSSWNRPMASLKQEIGPPDPGRDRARAGQGRRRGGQPGQERVPRQHEPRDPHADERRHRHDRPAARHAARPPSSANSPRRRAASRRRAAGHHQRHPRLLQDRGRQARARARSTSTCAKCVEDAIDLLAAQAAAEGPRARRRRRAGRARVRCAATRAGCARCCSTWSATRSSSPRRGEVVVRVAAPRSAADGAALRFEVRDTGIGIPPRSRRASSRPSPRPTARPRAVRRHRPRPRHLQAARRADGRRDRGRTAARARARRSGSRPSSQKQTAARHVAGARRT